jgi:hypothetical protein
MRTQHPPPPNANLPLQQHGREPVHGQRAEAGAHDDGKYACRQHVLSPLHPLRVVWAVHHHTSDERQRHGRQRGLVQMHVCVCVVVVDVRARACAWPTAVALCTTSLPAACKSCAPAARPAPTDLHGRLGRPGQRVEQPLLPVVARPTHDEEGRDDAHRQAYQARCGCAVASSAARVRVRA